MARQQAQLLWFLLAGYTREDFGDYFCLSPSHIDQQCYRLRSAGWSIEKRRRKVVVRQRVVRLEQELQALPKIERRAAIAERLGMSVQTVHVHLCHHRNGRRD